MNTTAIKSQAKQVGLVTAGFMGANAISKIAPIKNEKIKALIPILLGVGTAMVSKNANLKIVGTGVASYGLLKAVREIVVSSDPTTVSGIADNPMVKKMLDMLVPNLGDTGMGMTIDYTTQYEPAIVDVPFEDVSGIGMIEEGSLLGSIDEESLLGFDLDYQNEMYL